MKNNRIISIMLAMLLIFSCAVLASCEKEIEIETGVEFTIYENNGSDMISFYVESDLTQYGKWSYALDNQDIFTYFHDTESEEGDAYYRTLILQPIAEGSAVVVFESDEGGLQKSFALKVAKDSNDILRITCDETVVGPSQPNESEASE